MGILALLSCRKVIDIDLKLSDQAIVIEAEISDQAGPYTVYVSKAVNISNTNTFPRVTGASVTINDNLGNAELLTETSQGVYKTNTLQGTPGRIYTISVTADGKNYRAVSNMASPVTIDTLTVTTSISDITWGINLGHTHSEYPIYINVQFTDPAGIANYYRLVEIVNGVLVNTIYISSDIAFGSSLDGYRISETLIGNSDVELKIGDTVKIQLQNIDKNVYEYYRTFNQTSNGGGGVFDSPSNPISNLNNGALGYFSAYAVTSKIIILQ